ncbi:nucleotidyltransferase family protein [Halobellus limi]|uniref:Molybdenum cofactor cytidylyltransferase n=1 Tax=Halobellus limi TaxID=699433 RepID=A0A1H5ZMJ7_9EURY|nr:nucleotidyltransferase family protein [Halobellus limi]QCC48032.1 nucleotidyltransferase family protein [Halobellus limi]SEG37442.1 molybdenum cofactor cytidylyltransferase [Halobellus limi]
MTDGRDGADLPVVSPPFGEENGGRRRIRDRPRIAGVLLAAGTSTRFGDRNKLLATRDGDPLVRHAARTLLDAGLDPVVAVVGHEADRVADALSGLDVTVVVNDRYETGQASSLRAGIGALRDRVEPVDAAVIALGDMPFVDPETVETLVAAHDAGVGDALAAAHDGVRGNPVLFDRRFFDALADVSGDVGGREILLASGDGACVSVPDPGVRRDVDEPGDLDG